MLYLLWENVWWFPHKLRLGSSNATSGFISKRLKSRDFSKGHVNPSSLVSLFATAERQKQLKCPLINKYKKVKNKN